MFTNPVKAVAIQAVPVGADECVLLIQLDEGQMLEFEVPNILDLFRQVRSVLECQALEQKHNELHPAG